MSAVSHAPRFHAPRSHAPRGEGVLVKRLAVRWGSWRRIASLAALPLAAAAGAGGAAPGRTAPPAAKASAVPAAPAQGRTVLRRLNRVEYQNTLCDLLGIRMDVQDLLP